MTDYALILTRRYPGKLWTLEGDTYEGLTWLSETAKPSKKTLDELAASVKAEIIAEYDTKARERQTILDRLGITADELKTILP